MNLLIDEINIKKIILSGLQTSGYLFHLEIEKILNGLLTLNFDDELEHSSLQTASQYILAYLQLGFSYLEHKTLFDSILSTTGYTWEEISKFQKLNSPVILNKSQVRSMIGRWFASPYNSHTITDAVDEIIELSKSKKYGTYYYYTAKKDGTYTTLYELNISHDSIIFHDLFNNRYYSLIEK